jgi:multiple antibiotic resistance protein
MNLTGLGTYALLSFTSLIAIVNPLMSAPLYLAMTDGYTAEHRQHALRRAVTTGTVVLLLFALLGGAIFQVFGITIHAFRIAGGIILFGIGIDMLQVKPSRVRTTPEEEREGLRKEEIGITPLGVPVLVGPGSITTVMVLMADAPTPIHVVALLLVIVLTLGATYLLLRQGERLLHLFGRSGINVMTRIMGLLVTVIAVQFILDGARPVLIDVLRLAGSAGGP